MSSNSLTSRKLPQKTKKSSSNKIFNIQQPSEAPSLPISPSIRTCSYETRPIQSYKDEMVASFFTTMRLHIIDKKEIREESITEPNAENLIDLTITAKDFKDLIDNDLIQQEVVSVQGSQVSLGSRNKKMATKRNGHQSKRISQNQESIKSSFGSLGKKRKPSKSSSDILPRIPELESVKNLSDPYLELQIDSWRVKDSQEYVKITYKNGHFYEGPLRNQLFHGEGAFYWNDGTIYFGNFENGEITGLGKMLYSDMSIYHGKLFNGKPHGIGAFYMAYTRTLYNGNWVHGKKEGQGWLYYSENNWYDGEWYNDCRNGFGTRLYKNGTKYSGMWNTGIRHGQGACSFTNEDFYKGEWYNGELHGYGEYTWKAFFNKTLTFPVENIYQGGWTNGMRDGFGLLYFGLEHGARLIGFWNMNLKHGHGIVINCNGDVTERNPLFCNDKPAHISTTDDTSNYDDQTTRKKTPSKQSPLSYTLMKSPASYQEWLLRIPMQNPSCTTLDRNVSDMINTGSLAQQLEMKTSLYSWSRGNSEQEQVANVQNIDRLQDFPEERFLCNPLILHTRAAPETLNLNFYSEKYIDEVKDQGNMSILSSTNTQLEEVRIGTTCWKGAIEQESNNMRNLIWHNTKYLQTIYEMYANISNHPDGPNRKCTLIRLYLWQLYRDLKIYKWDISLFETDLILLENPGHCLETDHHPFERIYYWQFLWSLIGVAWQIHVNKKNKIGSFELHSVHTVFEQFLNNILYPNAGQHIGPCLFEFKNLLSIKDVIALYKDIGPVLTAREFLNKCCCKKRTEPPCHLQNFKDNYVVQPEYGRNIIAVGRNFVYLPDKKDIIMPNPKPDPYPLEIDKFFKTLKVFRHIGPQRVVNCLVLACPIIKRDGLIVNMDVKLTFLEFYETLIYCAYKSILVANLKERSKNYVFDDNRSSRSEKYDKRRKSRKDARKRKK